MFWQSAKVLGGLWWVVLLYLVGWEVGQMGVNTMSYKKTEIWNMDYHTWLWCGLV